MDDDDVTAHFLARTAELTDCAALIDESVENDRQQYLLQPMNPNAVGVRFISWGGDARWINFTDPISAPEDWRVDIEAVDLHIDAAVEGRVRALHGPSRGIVEAPPAEGDRTTRGRYSSYSRGLRGLIPRPGWKRRAKVIEYEPYR